jgi:hypothetical protein
MQHAPISRARYDGAHLRADTAGGAYEIHAQLNPRRPS